MEISEQACRIFDLSCLNLAANSPYVPPLYGFQYSIIKPTHYEFIKGTAWTSFFDISAWMVRRI